MKYLKNVVNQEQRKVQSKLNKDVYQGRMEDVFPKDLHKRVINLSSVTINRTTLEALSMGLNYGIHPGKMTNVHTNVGFERLYEQTLDLAPTSTDNKVWLKAALVEQAHAYNAAHINQRHALSKDHLTALQDCVKNQNIQVLRTDKGENVVVMNKADYKKKMYEILNVSQKFKCDPDAKDETEQK